MQYTSLNLLLKHRLRVTQNYHYYSHTISKETVTEHQSKVLKQSWEATHVMTSRGSDKLVVPEEKMADHEEQLSDEEKVRCLFNH